MLKSGLSITERVERAILNYPEKTYIAVHPDDFRVLKSEGFLNKFSKPLYELGSGGFEKDV
tara:strand:+ start:438 stop:620 length:183 start_codon:yes stop_codon:yes gene_type:complete